MHRMKGKMTRRQLAGTMLAATVAGQAPQPAPTTPAGELEAAREQHRRTRETMAQVKVPMDIEPAFHFSA